jgi:hypothetical protein
MVDLDQTLIHTTEQHCPQMSNKVSDASHCQDVSSDYRSHDSIQKGIILFLK